MLPECRKWRTPLCPAANAPQPTIRDPRRTTFVIGPQALRRLCKCVETLERAKNLAKSRTRCPKLQSTRTRDSNQHPLPAPCWFLGRYGCPCRHRPVACRLVLSRRTVEKFRPRRLSAAPAKGKASLRPESRTRKNLRCGLFPVAASTPPASACCPARLAYSAARKPR